MFWRFVPPTLPSCGGAKGMVWQGNPHQPVSRAVLAVSVSIYLPKSLSIPTSLSQAKTKHVEDLTISSQPICRAFMFISFCFQVLFDFNRFAERMKVGTKALDHQRLACHIAPWRHLWPCDYRGSEHELNCAPKKLHQQVHAPRFQGLEILEFASEVTRSPTSCPMSWWPHGKVWHLVTWYQFEPS